MKRLLARLELIEATDVLGVNVGWVNGNYQRILFHSVRTASADRVRRMAAPRRYLALVCFLHQAWRDTGLSQFAAPFLSRMKFVDEQGERTSPTPWRRCGLRDTSSCPTATFSHPHAKVHPHGQDSRESPSGSCGWWWAEAGDRRGLGFLGAPRAAQAGSEGRAGP